MNEDFSEDEFVFDFDKLYKEETIEDLTPQLNKAVPNIRNIKSKYGNSLQILTIINKLLLTLAPYSIKTKSGTRDINDFKKHLGIIKTIWFYHKPILGQLDINLIEKMIKIYSKAIVRYASNEDEYSYVFLVKVSEKLEERIHKVMINSRTGLEVSSNKQSFEKDMILG